MIYIAGPGHGGPAIVANTRAGYVKQALRDKLAEHHESICRYGEDLPEIRDWRWEGP